MSGSTILESQMAMHKIQQELKRRKEEPGYADASDKIYPIIEKYKSLAKWSKICAIGGGIVAGGIVGAAIGYFLKSYLPNMQTSHLRISGYTTFDLGMYGVFAGEIAGAVISGFKRLKLGRKAKKEIDGLGLEYTVDEDCFF